MKERLHVALAELDTVRLRSAQCGHWIELPIDDLKRLVARDIVCPVCRTVIDADKTNQSKPLLNLALAIDAIIAEHDRYQLELVLPVPQR